MIEQGPDNAVIDRLADIFERRGAAAYLGEDVTIVEHMLQCAALAEAEGAAKTLVAAALLHDIGYFAGEFEVLPEDAASSQHEATGAAFLEAFFPPVISEPVRLHVAAKRYLCATENGYYEKLSATSKHSLSLQGGPMDEAEMAQFRSLPFHREAVSVRLWDDAGKKIGLGTRSFAEYRPLLQSVLRLG